MPIEAMRIRASQGDPESQCGLVLAALGDDARRFDPVEAIDLLMRAARSRYAPALRCLGLAAAATGDTDMARDWLATAWSHGDPLAPALLATLANDDNDRQSLHALAASAGIARSATLFRPGTPTAHIELPTSLPPAPDPSCFAIDVSSAWIHRHQPRLQTHDGVFSALDCDYVIGLAGAKLAPSMVHDPRTGQPMRHPIRTSQSMTFPSHDGDLWLRQLQRRLATLAGLPFLNAEPLAVLRYGVGEEYRPHRDYLRGDDLGELRPDRPGQRLTTAFCYLNDVDDGGGTDFPALRTCVQPQRGRVVLFDNVRADGLPDPDTLHAGLPVRRGEKWLATLWFRERALRTF